MLKHFNYFIRMNKTMFLKLGNVYFKHMSWLKIFGKLLALKNAATLGINY